MQEEDAQEPFVSDPRRSRDVKSSVPSSNSRAKRWFAHVQGQNYGPYTELEIRQMAQDNQIVATDLLCPEGGTAWTQAKEEPLLGALFQPSTGAAALQSNSQTTAHPTASSARSEINFQAADYGRASKRPLDKHRELFRRADQDQVLRDLSVFFGPRADKYLAIYEKMRARDAPWARWNFNVPVFFCGFPWFFYRRMYLVGSLVIFLPILAGYLFGFQGNAGIAVGLAVSANNLYVLSGMKRLHKADELGLSGEERQEYLRRAGGVSVVAGVLASLLFVTIFALAIYGVYLEHHPAG